MKKIYIHSGGFQRGFGCIGVLLQVSLAISDSLDADELFLGPVYLAFAILFLATVFLAFLGPFQAALFFGLSAVVTLSSQNCVYGLGFAMAGAIILFRRGWFFWRPKIKACIAIGLGGAFFIVPILASHRPPIAFAPAFIGCAIYSVLIVGLARGHFLAALAPKKPALRLAIYKLNSREVQVVKACILGKTVKEMAVECGVTDSTIRNALWTASHKLGVKGWEMHVLGERFRVE